MTVTPRVFVREATGLVKEVGTADTFIYNTNNQNIGIGVLFLLLFVPSFYVGANLGWSLPITALLVLPTALVYAYLSTIMPRSGGDYVYISRVFGPALGFASGINWTYWLLIYIGIPAAYLGQYGVAPLTRYLAAMTGSAGVQAAAKFLSSSTGIWLVGTILIAVFTWVFIRGTKFYMRIQAWTFGIALVGLALVAVALLGNPGQFVARFNDYILKAGGVAEAYTVIKQAAADGGYAFSGYDRTWTAFSITQVFYILGFAITSSFIGGEIKNVRRSQFVGMPGSVVFCAVAMAILVFLFLGRLGYEFLGQLGFAAADSYGLAFTPTFTELAAVSSGSVALGVLIGVCFLFWTYVWLPINFLASTRSLLAWSFDRLLPESVAEVNPRTHTPIRAIIIVAILGEVSLILYVTGVINTLVGIFGWGLSFMLASLVAMALPYKLKDVFESSPVNHRVAGIPVLTILGAVSLVCLAYVEYLLWVDPIIGVSVTTHKLGTLLTLPSWVLNLGVPLAGFVAYYLIQWAQKRRGLDVSAAFTVIPPD